MLAKRRVAIVVRAELAAALDGAASGRAANPGANIEHDPVRRYTGQPGEFVGRRKSADVEHIEGVEVVDGNLLW